MEPFYQTPAPALETGTELARSGHAFGTNMASCGTPFQLSCRGNRAASPARCTAGERVRDSSKRVGQRRPCDPLAASINHRQELPQMNDPQQWRELGQQLRVDSVRSSAAASSGHPTSSMSAADLMAVLIAKHLRYDFDQPDNPSNDHLIFSKGHASPLVYAIFKAVGAVSDEEMLTFRRFGSRLEGHPTPVLPWVDVATGSLGQGLPFSVGIGLAGEKLDRIPYRIWCLCGDSEMAEGSMWEAFEHAAFYGLENLTAIIDVNKFGQRGETMHGWDLDSYANRARAFGWHAIEIDGHDVEAIDEAYGEAAAQQGQPTVIVAHTLKGKGVKEVEDKPNWHGKALDHPDEAIAELGGERNIVVEVAKPESAEAHRFEVAGGELPTWELGEEVATRRAYGDALA